MLGAVLCLFVMFVSAWHFAIIAIIIGVAVYKYIQVSSGVRLQRAISRMQTRPAGLQYAGAKIEWGDGLKGLRLSAARYALLTVDTRAEHHTRNWRPQLLVFYPTTSAHADGGTSEDAATLPERREKLLGFIGQLKAGKGLTMVAECIEGTYIKQAAHSRVERERLADQLRRHRIRGFCDVLVAERYSQGVASLIQTSGLGGLRHNTVVVAWPDNWRASSHSWDEARRFAYALRCAAAARCAILVPKSVCAFPASNERLTGTVDVWWIVHDGGLLMLLPFLLRKHRTWRGTRLRLYAIAHNDDDTQRMKEDLTKFLYDLRIVGQVHVIDMVSGATAAANSLSCTPVYSPTAILAPTPMSVR